jgi:hypothetical protein
MATNLGHAASAAVMVLAIGEQEFVSKSLPDCSSDLGFRFEGLGEQEFGHLFEAPQCTVAERCLDPCRVLCQPLAAKETY